ncbi:MAG: right-handed parallel beta-helix repeat-containing protein [Lachnospiraceae bacterium]
MKRKNRKWMSFVMMMMLTLTLIASDLMGAGQIVLAAKDDNATTITFNASELNEGDITKETVVGDFTLGASADKKFTVDANAKKNEDGSVSYTKRLKSNGASTDSERIISFTTGGAGTAKVYMISSNKDDAGRMLTLYDAKENKAVDGMSFAAPTAAGEGDKIAPVEYTIPKEGTYKFVASQGINIYSIVVEYEGGAVASVERKNWDEVADPVIKEVKINDKGTIDVNVEVEVGTDGADTARLFLFQNGYEAICEQIPESGVYTLEPALKGDFTVQVIASRRGCKDKESNQEKIKGYKIPLSIPEIKWVDNLGDGAVYVDWENLEADYFDLAIKKSADKDYKTIAAKITEGSYYLTDLEEGETYDIRVTATRDDRKTEDTEQITVGDPEQEWFVAAVGSATSGTMKVGGKEYEVKTSSGSIQVKDITGTKNALAVSSQTNGKIADSEDGLFFFYTRINPNAENFELTATFTVTDVKDGPDNQTGYGLFATDIIGIGSKDAKYFNSVSVGQFKLQGNGYHGHGARLVTGYTASNAYNTVGAMRDLNNRNSFDVKNETDSVKIGDTFTYTLKKTNEGFEASMEGASETITFEGTDSLMQQDDGSIYVGVASTRKVGVEVTDILFEKSEGTASAGAVKQIEPNFNIYSGTTSGVTSYEFIGSANVDGSLEVKDAAGNTIYNGKAEANKVIKADATLNMGQDNTFTYAFTPDASDNITSADAIKGEWTVSAKQWGEEGMTIYVSPSGSAGGKGTRASTLDLETAISYAQPGQIIVLLDGDYKPQKGLVIGRGVNGREDAPIVLMAENTGRVKIYGSHIKNGDPAILSVVGNYWHIYGLEFANGACKGVSVCGNYNTIEMCSMHNMESAGLQISRYSGEPNESEMWPTGNLIKNCDSYNNCDSGRTDADGFCAKLTCGEGNKFYGCIAHNNIDDGYDLYAKSTTGPIGAVVLENCVAYSNGFLVGDDPSDENSLFGEGNGFKLGGENMLGAHQLVNSVSYNNFGKGITSNSGPNCEVINCTSYNNSLNGKAYNISLYTKNSNPKAWILNGILSVTDNGTVNPELGTSSGVIYSLRSTNNYLFDGVESYNSEGQVATTDWFESTDVTVAPKRKSDGTIDMQGLLVLTADAPQDTGARIDTGSLAASVQPQVTASVSGTVEEAVDVTPQGSDSTLAIAKIVVIAGVLIMLLLVILRRKRR